MKIKHPEKLSREAYYKAYSDFLYLEKRDNENLKEVIREAIVEAFKGRPQ